MVLQKSQDLANYMQPDAKVWGLNTDYASKANFSKFNSNHPREYASLFANLQKINGLLCSGNKVGGFQVGFFRSEGGDVYRIGQTSVPNAKESRLYIFPDQETLTIYILGIGVKESQPEDVNEAKESVKQIRKERKQNL